MTGYEKFKDEIKLLIDEERDIAIDEQTNKPCVCSDIGCKQCTLRRCDCTRGLLEWLLKEWEAPKRITREEKALLELLNPKYKYAIRMTDGNVLVTVGKPEFKKLFWNVEPADRLNLSEVVGKDIFEVIGRGDVWTIEELKNIPLID